MTTVKATERWYEVRLGRILFFADPSSPGTSRRGNTWAKPGQFVEASHPVLRRIIRTQRHKIRQLKEGETIPAGSIIQDPRANPYIKSLMDKFDGREEAQGTRTAEEIVVGEAGRGAPVLTPAPATTAPSDAPAAPEATAPPPAAPVAPPAPPGAEATSVPPAPPAAPPAAPPPPGGSVESVDVPEDARERETQTIAEGDVGNVEDLGII